MSAEAENREFIKNKINPILERMMVDILVSKPSNVVSFMKEWLNSKGSQFEPKNTGDDSNSDESDEEVEELQTKEEIALKSRGKAGRASVSAEAYGAWNKKTAYVPKIVTKTQEQKERIKQKLEQAFMFSALDDKEKQIVVDAMEEVKFNAGKVIIQQGENGDNLFVVDSGELDCHKTFSKEDGPKYLKTYQSGESFGELALLYNAPRAATITAKTDVVLFSLDRECFNGIVKDAAAKKRDRYDEFLSKIDLLSTMDGYERSKIADALKPVKVKKGEYVVKEGQTGDTFYLIEDGEAIATKTLEKNQPPEKVFEYVPGNYFGELALLKDVPRQANIIALTDMNLVSLDRYSFKRLLGPLEELLKRNFSKYEKFAAR